MSDFLARMAATSAERVRLARQACPDSDMASEARLASAPARIPPHQPFDLIAEIKLRSPAEGTLGDEVIDWRTPLIERAGRYVAGGAAAISVLTEPSEFGGSLEHLRVVADAVSVPVMRKDFLVDPYQVLEARAHGASGVLVIARILSADRLQELLSTSLEWGMFVLLEAFDRDDLLAIEAAIRGVPPTERDQLLVGVNARNLSTLKVEVGRLHELASALPADVRCVAESGMLSAADTARAADDGYRMALVGSALMRSQDPSQLVRDMLASGRAVRA